jgi:hypothetical protein
LSPDEAKKIEVDLHRELVSICLQDEALVSLLASLLGEKSGAGSVLKDLANTLVGLCGTLEILVGTNLLPDLLSLLWCNWLLAGLVKLLDGLLVVAKILLTSDEDDWEPLAEMQHFGDPLLLDVVEGVGGVDGEADEDYVGIWVGERAETVVILLASCIPKSQLDVLSIDLNIGHIVLEDGWDVDLWESALGENNQQTSLTTSTVTDDDELPTDLRHTVGVKWCVEGVGDGVM